MKCEMKRDLRRELKCEMERGNGLPADHTNADMETLAQKFHERWSERQLKALANLRIKHSSLCRTLLLTMFANVLVPRSQKRPETSESAGRRNATVTPPYDQGQR
jgi:hypothetical protein